MDITIELLEAIGKNAALRHASGTELEKMLDDMQASDEFKRAASTGDAELIKLEMGEKSMNVNHSITGTSEEEEEEEERKEPEQDEHKDKS